MSLKILHFFKEKWIRNTSLFLFSQTVSTLGSSVVNFSIFWYLTLKYSSGIIITILILCIFIPQTLISLFAGVWADKYIKKYIIISADSFIAFATFILVIFIFVGNESLYIIYTATVIRSIGSGIQAPSISSLIPELVPRKYLNKVNAINNILHSVVTLLSPAIGGIILGSFGIVHSLMFDIITAIIGVGILSTLTVTKSEEVKDKNNESQIRQLINGVKYARGNFVINNILKLFTVIYIIVTPIAFLYPLLVERTYGNDIRKITFTEISWSLGMITGGISVVFTKKLRNKIKVSLWINFILGINFIIMGIFAHKLSILLMTLFLGGIFVIIGDTAETVFIQENTSPEMMGRIFSMLHMIRSLIFPLAILVFGPLADFMSIKVLICLSSFLLSFIAAIKLGDKRFIQMGNN